MTGADIRALFEARRAQIAAPIPFDIPGFGSVYVKVLDAATAAKNAELLSKQENRNNYLVFSAGLAICDQDGALVFDVSSPQDLEILGGIDPSTLNQIFRKSQLENAQSDEGVAAAGNA